MADLQDVTMAEDHVATSTLNTGNMNTQLLQELRGGIHFETTLTPSNVPNGDPNNRCSLELPPWFVAEHGDKFFPCVQLRSGSSTPPMSPFVVKISMNSAFPPAFPLVKSNCAFPPAFPQVKMSSGWRRFATSIGLREGDSLIFSLRAMSEFEVHVFREAGKPTPSPSIPAGPVNDMCALLGKKLTLGGKDRVSASYHNLI